MKALKSAQEDARLAKENEIEAQNQTGYVIEELKRMTMFKERAELETKQVMLRYGGLSMKQLIYPSEMNVDEAENLLENPIGPFKNEVNSNSKEDSSSFFSSFRRKLTEKFSFSTKKEIVVMREDITAPKYQVQSFGKQVPLHFSTTKNTSESPTKNESSLFSVGQSTNSPPKLSTKQRSKSISNLPQSQSPPVDRKSSPIASSLGNENPIGFAAVAGSPKQWHALPKSRDQDTSAKVLPHTPSRIDNKSVSASARNPSGTQHALTGDASDRSSRTSTGGSQSSRPSIADAGSWQSAKEVREDRLPVQYQSFRARQSNLASIPKLAFQTPRQLDASPYSNRMRQAAERNLGGANHS
jgi:hypothetical protein